jgi:hypothetical protein
LAGRDSFQKRQKEAARREKRQLKLERRQGRQQPSNPDSTSETDENGIAKPLDLSDLPLTTPPGRPSADPLANAPHSINPAVPEPALERRVGAFKPSLVEPERPKNDSPPREP